jgi:hypothetical protein
MVFLAIPYNILFAEQVFLFTVLFILSLRKVAPIIRLCIISLLILGPVAFLNPVNLLGLGLNHDDLQIFLNSFLPVYTMFLVKTAFVAVILVSVLILLYTLLKFIKIPHKCYPYVSFAIVLLILNMPFVSIESRWAVLGLVYTLLAWLTIQVYEFWKTQYFNS